MPIEIGSFSLGIVAGGLVVRFFDHFLAKSRAAEARKIEYFNKSADEFAAF